MGSGEIVQLIMGLGGFVGILVFGIIATAWKGDE